MNAGKRNLHTHTTYCDGHDTPEELAREAVRRGFSVLGFSGHAYTSFDDSFCMSRSGTEAYVRDIMALRDAYRGRLEIRCGVERDYFSDDPAYAYDFVIGSVHYVKPVGVYRSVDESAASQLETVRLYYAGDFYKMAEDYYRLVSDVVQKTRADIIGHFDLIRKFNDGGIYFDEENPRYRDAAFAALDALLKTGKPFELNTGVVARGYSTRPYPAEPLRTYILEHGGELIPSSDCHRKELLDFGLWGSTHSVIR